MFARMSQMSRIDNDDFDRSSENLELLQWNTLRKLCCVSVEYFRSDQNENGVRIKDALLVILKQLDELQPLYNEIAEFASHFDFDEKTPGNGYRSFLTMIDKCVMHSEQVCREMYSQKDSMLFQKSHHMKEIEASSQLLVSLQISLRYLKILYAWSTEVMSDGKLSLLIMDHSSHEFLNLIKDVNQHCFYGRCVGFQFCSSLKKTLKTIAFAMAAYSEMYYNNSTILERCVNFIKYFLDPEARARRIVNLSQYADISFIQAFYSLTEKRFSIITPSLAINRLISVPPEELILPTLDGRTVSIPIPNSHIGKKPIQLRLLSSKRRLGMIGSGKTGGELYDQCDGLIIHIHGGGFVAQTSQSHEMYLNKWATMLDVPILSIDYSLAPQAPYPRALEEVLYAYAWALKNASTILGSTAKKVIFVGDSAGGTLNLGAILKCLQLNIKKPDGIFMAYAPVVIDFIPSPSHMLFLSDTFLLLGFIIRCLKAYVGSDDEQLAKKHENEECAKLDTESPVKVNKNDFTLALHPNEDSANGTQKLVSLPADLLNVNLTEVDGQSDKSWSLFGWLFNRKNNENVRQLDIKNGKTPSEEFAEFTTSKDLFENPYLAPNNMLVHFPPMKILTVELDPCLDDCVMFARKLRSLGNKVTLDILPDLPHGFLNLVYISKETMEGVELSAKRIKELLEL